MCRQWMTQHKVHRIDGRIAQTKAGGKKSLHEWASTLEEKSHTWNEKLYRQAKMAANDEKGADEERHNINELYEQLCKERKKR